jgi:hypothetical protein
MIVAARQTSSVDGQAAGTGDSKECRRLPPGVAVLDKSCRMEFDERLYPAKSRNPAAVKSGSKAHAVATRRRLITRKLTCSTRLTRRLRNRCSSRAPAACRSSFTHSMTNVVESLAILTPAATPMWRIPKILTGLLRAELYAPHARRQNFSIIQETAGPGETKQAIRCPAGDAPAQ